MTGSVLLPGDAGYDDERAVFNLNHELVPAVIVVAHSAIDVQAAVAFAAGQHRPVLVKATGHQVVGTAQGAVLITTHRMNDVVIDAVSRTAKVGAGALWADVVGKGAEAGLAPLNGSNPTVGVVGYTLGGGLSPTLGRSQGYAADHVRSLDVVTADSELRHVDAESDPELFWALRGGKGNFGIAELRALGGAWDREPAVPNAVATRGLPYVLLGVEVGPLSEEQRLKKSIAALLDGMARWRGDRRLVNNLAPEEATDAVAIYGPQCYERLARVKKTYDPTNMFRLNHNVVPAVWVTKVTARGLTSAHWRPDTNISFTYLYDGTRRGPK